MFKINAYVYIFFLNGIVLILFFICHFCTGWTKAQRILKMINPEETKDQHSATAVCNDIDVENATQLNGSSDSDPIPNSQSSLGFAIAQDRK